jgi:PII-like signaling protein
MSLSERGPWPLALANVFGSKLFCLSAAFGAWHSGGCCKMTSAVAVQVTIHLNKGDQWRGQPMAVEILNYLRRENVCAATAIRKVEGFLGRQVVETAHLVDARGKLPVMIIFGDTDEQVNRGLPVLKEMAIHRLIVRENVVLEQGNLD